MAPPSPASSPAPAACVAEVVVRLGDTRLDVRHLRAARGGRSAGAWASLAAASLAAAAALAGISGAIGAALACLLVGAGALAAALARADRRARDRFRIGEGHGVDLPLAIAGAGADGAAPLVQVGEGGVVLGLFEGLDGEQVDGAALVSLDELRRSGARTCRLPLGARAELRRGPLTIEVRALAVEAAPLVDAGPAAVDRPFWRAQAASLALLGGLFVALAQVERVASPAVELDPDAAALRRRIVVALAATPAPSPAPQRRGAPPERAPEPAAAPRPRQAPRVADDGGRSTAPTVELDGASIPVPRGAQAGPWSPRPRAGAAPAGEQGALLGDAARDWMANVEARSQERYRGAREDADAWAALTGRPPDMTQGTGGLALKAALVDPSARGVVGITDREIAEAFMAQRAKARRRPRDDRFRERPVVARSRDAGRTVASTSPFAFSVGGPPQVHGSLDRGHAGEVVRHNRPHIAQCWTDARRRDPDLKARFTVAVTVGPRGKVKRVEVPASLGDPELGRCLAMAIRAWRYEAPPDGEPSVVTYALSFGGA